jgi:hypothetical protein
MDRNDALRIVIFEYLLPDQIKSRRNALHKVVILNSHLSTGEPYLSGLMEHIWLLSDALLNARGYPTSFVSPIRRIQYFERRLVEALVIPAIDLHVHKRPADPPGGYRIFHTRNQNYPYLSIFSGLNFYI